VTFKATLAIINCFESNVQEIYTVSGKKVTPYLLFYNPGK